MDEQTPTTNFKDIYNQSLNCHKQPCLLYRMNKLLRLIPIHLLSKSSLPRTNMPFSYIGELFNTTATSPSIIIELGSLPSLYLLPNVLKTGPDRLVQPVEPSTGRCSGPDKSRNRYQIKAGLYTENRSTVRTGTG